MNEMLQTKEMPDLQKVMLENFLNEIDHILERGFEDKDKDALKSKFIELFDTTTETDFGKRLLTTYDLFKNWLEAGDYKKMNEVAKFCMPLLRSLAERALEISEKNNKPADILEYKK